MATHLTVTGAEQITPTLRRLWFRSDDLSAFAESTFTDRYVKLVFPKPGVDYPEPLDMRELRRTLPPEDMPTVRTYTALFPDVAAGTLAIDFVIHGDQGVAGPWAAAAQPGDTLLANGPGGAYAPDPSADWHLLAGDEAALPALTAALHALPDDAVVRLVVVVDDAEHEPELPVTSQTETTIVHRSGDGPQIAPAVRAIELPAGRGQAFVHGEASDVMHGVRPYLLTELAMPRADVSISGYWRHGRTEEGFREWKSELRKAEES